MPNLPVSLCFVYTGIEAKKPEGDNISSAMFPVFLSLLTIIIGILSDTFSLRNSNHSYTSCGSFPVSAKIAASTGAISLL